MKQDLIERSIAPLLTTSTRLRSRAGDGTRRSRPAYTLVLSLLIAAACAEQAPDWTPQVVRIVASHVQRGLDSDEGLLVSDVYATEGYPFGFPERQALITSGFTLIEPVAYDSTFPTLEFRYVTQEADAWVAETTLLRPDTTGATLTRTVRWLLDCDPTGCSITDSTDVDLGAPDAPQPGDPGGA
jgi:hypothetical protein